MCRWYIWHDFSCPLQSITGYMYRLTLELASAEEDPAEASQNVKIMDVEVWGECSLRIAADTKRLSENRDSQFIRKSHP